MTEQHSPREGPAGTARRGGSASGPEPVPPSGPGWHRTPLPPVPQTDRLQYLDVATRRIARGMDLDETLRELRWAAVPDFADAIVIHLHDPLPVGDEKSAAPVVLRLHSVDRAPEARTALLMPHAEYADVTDRVEPTLDGRLAKLLLA
ncbi:serine/threonine protein phosphatase, partial [Streptomyces sp. W16]|nr:serine/threonine protein phosphatase [Streptomyces sp. W16]